jgi:hypothetical protein
MIYRRNGGVIGLTTGDDVTLAFTAHTVRPFRGGGPTFTVGGFLRTPVLVSVDRH